MEMRALLSQRRELRSVRATNHGWGAKLAVIFLSCLLVPVQGAGQVSAQSTPEIRIIVVDSQSEASQILKRLQAGEDFAIMAREKSIDPSSGNGGSLGRIDPTTLRT